MPNRRAAPSSIPPPRPAGVSATGPTREAFLAALAERERELTEAQARQTATAEILRVISQSPTDARPVFERIVETAKHVLRCEMAVVLLREGDVFLTAAAMTTEGLVADVGRTRVPIDAADNFPSRAIVQKKLVYLPDWSLIELPDHERKVQERWGVNSALYLPLLREGECIGALALVASQPNVFGHSEIAQAESFCDQALIAIENARLFNETQEALARQTATSEILRVISQSPTDARPVFESIVVTATRLLRCDMAFVLLREGDAYVHTAGATPEGPIADLAPERIPIDAGANFPSRAFLAKTMLHLPDWSRIDLPEHERRIHETFGVNSVLYLPLLRGDECIGLLAVGGRRANIFGPSEIAQAESFRDQALIAMENARLFNETQEALERQTATAEVLKVIASSPSDTQPVFEVIAASANRLLGGFSTTVIRFVGDALHLVAFTPTNVVADEALQAAFPRPVAEFPPFLLVRDGETQQFVDTEAETGVPPVIRELARLRGYRSMLFTPLMSSDGPVGMISVTRKQPGAFDPDDVQLLRTFADQAVIAIQNARLFSETQEALEQQKASADVLGAISKSVADTAPVFEEIIGACQRLFGSDEIGVYTIGDDDMVRVAAWRGPRAEEVRHDVTPLGESVTGRIIRERRTHHIPDLRSEPNLSPTVRERVNRLGGASLLYAPMLWEDRGLGSILVVRSPPKPFSDREQALLQSFADQAAIAIQNARLFRETQEALERQTATANVLKVISRSVSDAAPVFEAILESCQRLFGLEAVAVYLVEGDMVKGVAHRGWTAGDWGRDATPLAGSSTGLAIAERRAIHVPDLAEKPGLPERFVAPLRAAGGMSVLYAPMLWEDRGVGSIVVSRQPAKPFSEREIALLQSFADQAAIAIQNARLFEETQAKTRDLTEALQQQTATADVLKVISRSAFDLSLAASTILEAAARLCRAPLATLHLRDGDVCRLITQFGLPEAFEREARENPIPVRYPLHSRRTARAGEVAHYSDAWADPDYLYKAPAKLAGYRALVVIPLMREGELVGIFSLGRPEPDPFTESQIKLTQTFADQAAIAIENARLFNEVKARTEDLSEALQQQTATADVLKVISRSVFDLQTVLDTLVDSAYVLCGAGAALLYLRSDDGFECKAIAGAGAEDVGHLFKGRPIRAGRGTAAERVIMTGEVHSITDLFHDPDVDPKVTAGLRGAGLDFRSTLAVPMKRDDAVVGVLVIARGQTGSFPQRQVDLLQTFADQAVIAIENVRLFDEVQARTRDLTEALQQQTATSEVLKVISRSAFDLDAVLNSLTKSAVQLCNSTYGVISLYRDGVLKFMAQTGCTPEFAELLWNNPAPLDRKSATGRAALLRTVVLVPDVTEDEEYDYHGGEIIGNYRSMMSVPMLRNGELEGVFTLMRREPGLFTPRQVELVQTFADQAVIAIENVRLFDEVQARTRDLTEALQQQTATADVLKAISRTAFDLDTVLETLISTAVRLCEAKYGEIFRRDGDLYRFAASLKNAVPGYVAHEESAEIQPGRGTLVGRVAMERRPVQIADAWNDPDYAEKDEARMGDVRSMLGVPLMRDGEPIGAFALARSEAIPFTRRQVELVSTFADQAVIAIENVRLFDEVQARTRDLTEALQMQTATSDVLKVISRSAFDLQAVFNTLVTSAVELSGALTGTICVREGDVFRYRDTIGAEHTSALAQYLRDHPATPGRSTIAGRVLLSGKVERIPDCLADPDYVVPMGSLATNVRSLLGVPLLRKDGVEGAIILTREEPGHFSDRQVEIVQTFADQAVIALENVRLFDEVQARTRELAASLDDLRKAQDRLIQSEKLASLGQLTAGIAHEIKNPLNFVNNFSALTRELVDELGEALKRAPLQKGEREEADELIGTIGANLDKVVSHGKRADSIVKNMLLHSREGSGERTSVNVNAMVEEALNLAYHGARAEKPGFNVTIARSLDDKAGVAELYAQEMTRVLLNLISNAFYATTKRKDGEKAGSYEPTVTASTRDLGHSVEIAIRDNGTGIPDQVKAKMFNPFFTTKPAGEGTGLGLSLSHDIIVKQHGGTLEVSTEPGSFTQFTIVMPRAEGAA